MLGKIIEYMTKIEDKTSSTFLTIAQIIVIVIMLMIIAFVFYKIS